MRVKLGDDGHDRLAGTVAFDEHISMLCSAIISIINNTKFPSFGFTPHDTHKNQNLRLGHLSGYTVLKFFEVGY